MADLDSDGDMDVLAAACEGSPNRLGWLENDGSEKFSVHILKSDWIQPNSVYSADLDNDGDMDIVGTASYRANSQNGRMSWFENDGSQNFTEHGITSSWGRPNSVYADDVDGDGDLDLLAASCYQVHRIGWFENDGEGNFNLHILNNYFQRPHSVFTADFDLDGDKDIVAASIEGHQIAWWENDGETNFTKHTVCSNFNGATTAFPVDIDRDGDVDILGTAQYANKISWWGNNLPAAIERLQYVKPERIYLENNYPNPFNSRTTIKFQTKEVSHIKIAVYDAAGSHTTDLYNGIKHAGEQSVSWDGRNKYGAAAASGIYFYKVEAPGFIKVNKMLLIK